MSRGPLLRPESLTPEQRELYDEFCSGPRVDASRPNGPVDAEGRLTGPFNGMLYSPSVGLPLQRLGAALRYQSRLDDGVRELVILLVAGHHDSAYERVMHQRVALRLGLSEALLAAVDRGQIVDLPDAADLHPTAPAALELARRLLHDDLPDDAAYARLQESLGDDGIFEVNTLVGYYALIARQMALFGVVPAPTTGAS